MYAAIAILEPGPALTATLPDLPYDITSSGTTRILRGESGDITLEPFPQPQSSQDAQSSKQCLALITQDHYCVSFEANVDGFIIAPTGVQHPRDYHTISLPLSTEEHRWSTILRPNDSIRFSTDAAELHLILAIRDKDAINVTSSIQQPEEEMEREVPETQDRLTMSAPVPRRRKEKPVAKRSAVQVEQSMQGSNTIRSTPPSRTTQQSLIVEETPATNRKLAITEHVESNAGQEGSVDPKELVISTDVTTPTAVRDSFADNHKTMRAEQIVPSLELGSPDASTPSDLNEEEDATASEDENEEAQKAEDPDFSTAPEGKSATPKAASTAPESSSSPPQAMGEMELEDMTPSAAEQEMDRDKIADEEAEETPQAYPNSLLRQRPQPEVRITPSRSKKRSALEETPPHKPTKKSRRTKEQAQSQDPLASSIRVRAPSSAGPTPSTGKGEAVSQRIAPAKPQTPVASQSSRRSTSSAIEVKSPYKGKSPRVACSNTDMAERSGFPSFLRKAEVHIAEKVTEKGCDIVCIGISHGTYVKSAKLLLGLALGKQIVSEQWLLESRKAGKLLATSDFPPMRAPEEWRWGHTKEDVNEVLSLDRSKLFKGKVLFITPALKKEYGSGYSELERIAKAAGGKVMSKSAGEYKNRGDTVILALEKNDPDSITLMGGDKDEGHLCYHKDLISMSIIRGSLDLDSDEFKIKPNSGPFKAKGPAGRKRKSGQ